MPGLSCWNQIDRPAAGSRRPMPPAPSTGAMRVATSARRLWMSVPPASVARRLYGPRRSRGGLKMLDRRLLGATQDEAAQPARTPDARSSTWNAIRKRRWTSYGASARSRNVCGTPSKRRAGD